MSPGEMSDIALIKGIDLDGQVAIVTGGGMGIGKATARVLALAGCRVVIGDIDGQAGAATARTIQESGGTAVAVTMDVASRQDAQRLADTALAEFRTIDILANIAGIYPAALVTEMSEEEWDRVYAVNVNAISPGWVATERAVGGGRFYEGLKHVPLGRGAAPEEIGQVVLFLASPAAAFMTGENVVVAGGCVMD